MKYYIIKKRNFEGEWFEKRFEYLTFDDFCKALKDCEPGYYTVQIKD